MWHFVCQIKIRLIFHVPLFQFGSTMNSFNPIINRMINNCNVIYTFSDAPVNGRRVIHWTDLSNAFGTIIMRWPIFPIIYYCFVLYLALSKNKHTRLFWRRGQRALLQRPVMVMWVDQYWINRYAIVPLYPDRAFILWTCWLCWSRWPSAAGRLNHVGHHLRQRIRSFRKRMRSIRMIRKERTRNCSCHCLCTRSAMMTNLISSIVPSKTSSNGWTVSKV